MDIKLNTEDTLRTASDAFVTFLYAASVHVIIAHFVRPGVMITASMSALILLFIIFLFSDWLSRVRLPWLLPPADQVGVAKQLAKTILEVAGLLFLVLACLAHIEYSTAAFAHTSGALGGWERLWDAPLKPYIAFAAFLLATFLWNLFMLRVMRQLTWRDLAFMVLNGLALDSDKAKIYAKRFWQLRGRLEDWVTNTTPGTGNAFINFGRSSLVIIIEALARTGAQIVTFHITWANLLAGAIILVSEVYMDGKPLGVSIYRIPDWINATSFLSLVLILSPMLSLLSFLLETGTRHVVRLLHGIVLSLLLIALAKLSLLSSSFLNRISFGIFLAVAVPTVVFVFSSQCQQASMFRTMLLYLAGIINASMLVCWYLMVEPKVLMFVVAIQQVGVNIFLQYAASERQIAIRIHPPRAVMRAGATQRFTAAVSGITQPGLLWGTDNGAINSEGFYTAPLTSGTFKVCALLEDDQSRFGEATVIVLPAPGQACSATAADSA